MSTHTDTLRSDAELATVTQLAELPEQQLVTLLEDIAGDITTAEARVAELYQLRLRVMLGCTERDDRVLVRTIASAAGVSEEAVTLQLRKGRKALAAGEL